MLAARAASRLGLLRGLRQARVNHGLLVLAYHRVGDPAACPVNEELFSVTTDGLAEHVRLLRRWARITELDEVLAASASGRSLQEPLVLLTFDDVYRDNYTAAFPILREAGASGVFFVPTGLIECRHVPWWDRIAYAVKRSRVPSCRLRYPDDLTLEGLHADPQRAMIQVLRRYKQDPELDKERMIEALEAATGASALDSAEFGELFASWSELREMAAAGMTLASHTHTHRLLGHLPYPEQVAELSRSTPSRIPWGAAPTSTTTPAPP